MRLSRFFAPSLLCLSLAIMPVIASLPQAHAEDAPAAQAPAAQNPNAAREAELRAKMDAMKKNNPEAAKLDAMGQALFKSIKPDEARRVADLRAGFGMVRTVQLVREDIAASAKECGAKDPAIKSKIETAAAGWRKRLDPIVAEHESRMKDSINARNFTNPAQVQAFLDQFDKTANIMNQELRKQNPRVTTPEACASMADTVEGTSDQFASALDKIVWPGERGADAPAAKPAALGAQPSRPAQTLAPAHTPISTPAPASSPAQ